MQNLFDFFANLSWQFDSFGEFLAMGNHGLYVWICYGVTLVFLGANVIAPILQRKQVVAQLSRRFRSEAHAEQSSKRG